MANNFKEFLDQFDESAWEAALDELAPETHEVDRTAVRVWFRIFPLALFRYLASSDDREKAIQRFVMQGAHELNEQVDSSHGFLYGHRFWPHVKAAIENRIDGFSGDAALADEIRHIAHDAAKRAGCEVSLTTGIAAVGLMTLVQAGEEAFRAASGKVEKPSGRLKGSPAQIVAARSKDDAQGLLGFLRTVDKRFTVVYDESERGARFEIFSAEELASASGRDQSRNWRDRDPRCIEGVIPVECRSASCGTCWVGVLGGAEKLSEVAPLERKRMKIFGYRQGDDPKPFLRLACQAKAFGNVSLVIPPWNGMFGKKVYGNVEEVELEPATTSAAKLRETIKSVASGD